ncbi:cytochrome p450 [Colletotrichum incanum]|uniref:Cytochrome p450 n=1 Tax=Colletotrichum incanum TaxID=1573173 RepID=A0A162NM18_COLIC|nr:cytochrome p450 [Colletotrichum incanum]
MGISKLLLSLDTSFWQSRWAIIEGHWSPTTALFVVFTLYALYRGVIFVLGLYRRYLHPLSNFPGHPEACVSTAWAFREALKGFPEETFEILHQQYSTKALRVGPNELHISDVELYKVIYKQTDPFPKYEPFYMSFDSPHTVFAEIDTVKHKERRRLLNPMFSRAGIIKLEPLIHEKLFLLDRKIEKLCRQKKINVYNAFRLLTTEIIMQFAFAQSAGMIEEQDDDFGSGFTDALSVASHSVYLVYEKPWIRYLGKVMPTRILRILNPALGNMMNLIEVSMRLPMFPMSNALSLSFAATSVRRWQEGQGNRKEPYPIVFDRLGSLSESEKMTEGIDLLVAGSDTTASTVATAVMQILSNPDIEKKLVNSLDAFIPSAGNPPQLLDLEKIEYLVHRPSSRLITTTLVHMMLTHISF